MENSRMNLIREFLAQGVGFEPTCLTANGFQDRLVMTTSITLPVLYRSLYLL